MGNKNPGSNIIQLRTGREDMMERGLDETELEEIGAFMVDMLDAMIRIATRKDLSMLIYFLDMAKMEAMDLKDAGDEGA